MTFGASVMALLAGAAIAGGVSCQSGSNVTSLCVFENGAIANGGCLTLCQSQCALARGAGCAGNGCEATCAAADAERTASCRDATYGYWRCLRTSGGPGVECEPGGVADFVPAAGICDADRRSVGAACGSSDVSLGSATDAGRDADAAESEDGSTE